MTTTQPEIFDRTFNTARKAQGFRDQAHLDAFYAYFDHVHECAECQKPGPPMPLDDGMQPTHQLCDEARRLDALSV